MSILTEQDRNNIFEGYQELVQQLIDAPDTPDDLRSSVLRFGNAGQVAASYGAYPVGNAPANQGIAPATAAAPAPAAPARAGMVRGEPVAPSSAVQLPSEPTPTPAPAPGSQTPSLQSTPTTLKSRSGMGFLNNPSNPQLASRSGMGFLNNPSNPQLAPAAASTPAPTAPALTNPNLRGRPTTGGTRRAPGVSGQRAGQNSGRGLGEILQPYMDRLHGRSSSGTAVEAPGGQSPRNIPQPTTLNPKSGIGYLAQPAAAPAAPAAAPTPAARAAAPAAPAAAAPAAPAPAAPATSNNIIPVNQQTFRQLTGTAYNQGSVADRAVLGAGNALNTQFTGLDPNKAFHTAYDAGIRKALGLGSGGTNVAKAMNAFSGFLMSTDQATAQKIADMKINSTSVANMVKQWATKNNYDKNAPITASYEYKGDSRLLWEAYQDITRY